MKLFVCLEGQVAGTLETYGSRTEFRYTDAWLQSPGAYPLSQSLPLVSTPHTGTRIGNFLWGLLPDNELTLATWARQFQVSARNPVALLAHVGEDCAGAVQFVREERLETVLENSSARPEVEWLSQTQLEQRIRHLSQDASATRESAVEGQFSLSGAQAKTALYYQAERKRWGIPRGRTPTTHILKPAANEFDGFAENEHFCLALAQRIGLPSANTEWQLIGAIPTLIAERYDRIPLDGTWHRVHQEDCCQALGVHPASKYENAGGPGFPQIMSLLASSDDPELDRDRLMRTACFVYLLAATDAHAKNYSLLHARGTVRPSMRLAPLYDIASAWPYSKRIQPQKMKLAMRIGRHYRVQEIQPRHFRDLAQACNYAPERLLDMLRALSDRLPDEALALLAESSKRRHSREMLSSLVDKLGAQCRATQRRLATDISDRI